ncbi:MAG: hypothetical protein V1798_06010 [Pseudomonadota bacterium]
MIVCSSSISVSPHQGNGTSGTANPTCLGSESANKLAQEDQTPVQYVTIGGESVGIYDHPRIWLNPTWIDALKAKAVSSNPMWASLDETNTEHLNDYTNKASASILLNFALGFVVSGNPNYLTAAKKVLSNFQDNAIYTLPGGDQSGCLNGVIDNGSIDLIYIGAAYDWLAADLGEPDKTNIRNWVFDTFIPFLRQCHYWDDPDHNLGHTKWIGELIWSLATVGDDSRANDILDYRYTFWRDQMAPIFDRTYPGGHSYGGSGYGYNRSYKYALYGMEALTTCTTLNGYDGHPWAVDGICYRMHSVLPSQAAFHSDWEVADAHFNEGRMNENEALMVRRFQGSQEAKFGQFFLTDVFRVEESSGSWSAGNPINALYAGLWFLWYDPAYEKESYFTEPTAYMAPGLGVGFSRTSWSDTSSAWASFSAAPFIGDHQLHNDGSFKIWKNGEYLVIENGSCYAGQNSNETPPDTNILFVGDGMNTQYDELTGGIRRRETSNGSITKFSQGTTYAYFVGDIGDAYDPDYYPMNSFQRIWTHFRPASGSSDDYFVLIDRVDGESAWAKKQYVYTAYVPTVAGKDATITTPTAKNRLAVRSVLPDNATVAKEDVTDKTETCLTQEENDHPSRLTISEGSPPQAKQMFVTVFQVGVPASAMPTTEALASTNGSLKGVLIKDGVQNRGLLVSATSDAVSGTISFSTTASAGSEFIVGDLPANQKYNATYSSGTITLEPSDSGSVSADSQGVLDLAL